MSERLHYEVMGAEDGPSLLLIHGFMSSTLQWRPNLEALSKPLKLVCIDLWGHGKSPTPRELHYYEVAHYTAEFARIREEVGGGPWFVCGQSFGAGIAIRDAMANAAMLSGLIITNSRSALNNATADQGRNLDESAWEELDKRSLPYHPIHARRFPEDLKAEMMRAADEIPNFALFQGATATMKDLSCRDEFADVSLPILLVNGRYEKAFQPDRDFAVQAKPDLEVADLDGGHSVNIEAPREFERAVLDFVAKHTPAS